MEESRATWLVRLWLMNSYEMYLFIRYSKRNVRNLCKWSIEDRTRFKTYFKELTGCTDKIEWNEVDWTSVRYCIEDLATD